MTVAQTVKTGRSATNTAYAVLAGISCSHFLNDMIQSLILALYPLFKSEFQLSFAQIGSITLAWQFTASLLQPVVGWYTDRTPRPYSLVAGMAFTLFGLLLLAQATHFPLLLLAAAFIGAGSAVFHPESSRVARMASGGKHGLAQSIFQVGGNAGSAVGPLAAAWIVLPHGQRAIAWFSLAALLALVILFGVGRWYAQHHSQHRHSALHASPLPRRRMLGALAVLLALIFSKFFYMASINNYLTFYLMDHFALSTQAAQFHLFVFLFAVAAGTLLGGPIGDRIGRKRVIWASILGIAPFTLALPYAGLSASPVLLAIIGFMLASAFPAILIYAQELVPGRIGTVSGLFFGLAFGLASIGAAVLGHLADHWGIAAVYHMCAYLPLLGGLAIFLPELHARQPLSAAA